MGRVFFLVPILKCWEMSLWSWKPNLLLLGFLEMDKYLAVIIFLGKLWLSFYLIIIFKKAMSFCSLYSSLLSLCIHYSLIFGYLVICNGLLICGNWSRTSELMHASPWMLFFLYLNVVVRMRCALQNKNILSMDASQIIPLNPFILPISTLATSWMYADNSCKKSGN